MPWSSPEVVLRARPAVTGAALQEHVDRCAARIRSVLGQLASVQQSTAEHAPAAWAAQYAPGTGSLADVLFLDGIEAGADGELSLVFDFGDLDQLVARIDGQGGVAEVGIRA